MNVIKILIQSAVFTLVFYIAFALISVIFSVPFFTPLYHTELGFIIFIGMTFWEIAFIKA